MADFYPHSMEAKKAWHANFEANIAAFATKYDITSVQLGNLTKDNDWMQFWVDERFAAASFASQLAAYFNSISGNDPSLDPPSTPAYQVGSTPLEVPPGIEFRVR